MTSTVNIHPLNAKGKYYVDQDSCCCSDSCQHHAPHNFKYEPNDNHSYYVVKQPETPDEEKQCRAAMNHCPVEAIHDDGLTLKGD